MRMSGFEEDVVISHVGLLLRKAAKDNTGINQSWLLDVKGYPIQNKRTTLFSNLPFLIRGHAINATRECDLKSNFDLSIDSTRQFEEVPLSNYAGRLYPKSRYIDDRESSLWGYRFFIKGTELIFPQLEMARALFLNTAYLTRKSMGTALIDLEFDRQFDELTHHLNIHLTKANNFSVSALDSRQVRQMLAWLLFQPDALRSYQSIYRHYVQERQFEGDWEKWAFRFDLPNLSGWKMSLRGRYIEGGRHQFFVEEISGVVNASPMPRRVTFSGEMFKEFELVEGPRVNLQEGRNDGVNGSSNNAPPIDDTEIDDTTEPNEQATPVIFNLPMQGMSFLNSFDSQIVAETTIKRSDGTFGEVDVERPGSATGEENGTASSTNEATFHGTGRQAELIPKEQTQNEELEQKANANTESTFAAFDKMVSLLQKRYKWEVEEESVFELAKVGRSRLHRLKTTGHPRKMKAYLLSKKVELGWFYVRLVEVDTTDGVKALSTKILQQDTVEKWEKALDDLKSLIVKKSITWPSDILGSVYGNKVRSLKHPHCSESTINGISPEEVERWVERADLEMSTIEQNQG